MYSVLKVFRSENGAHFRDGGKEYLSLGLSHGKPSLGLSHGKPYMTSHDIHDARMHEARCNTGGSKQVSKG